MEQYFSNFAPPLKSSPIFEDFEKKDDPHTLYISKIT